MNRPNILCVYVDQLREDALGCTGNQLIRTPNFDRVAREGVRFSEAYVSTPLCTPFRGSFMTGRYAHAAGVHANHFPIKTDQTFLAHRLSNAGYATGYIGKWHLYGGPKPGFVPPGPDRCGFETFVGFNRGHEYDRSIFYYEDEQPYHCPRHEPDYQTDQAIDHMRKVSGAGDRPFFTYLCLGPPHHPMKIPDHWKYLYRPEEVPLPKGVPDPELQRTVQGNIIAQDFGGDPTKADHSHNDKRKIPAGEPETEEDIRRYIAEYYGMIANVDWNIGRLLDWLDASGNAENTFVLVFSDHGDMFGQHGYYCGNKRLAYRGSMHVPVLVRHPGHMPPGTVCDALIDLSVDALPTLLDIAGQETPTDIHGRSFAQLAAGERSAPTNEAIFYQLMLQTGGLEGDVHPRSLRGRRDKNWLYVRDKHGPQMLYDLRTDPDEEVNLVADPAFSGVLAELDAWVLAKMDETGDDWDQEHPFPPPNFVTHQDAARLHGATLQQAVTLTAPRAQPPS